MGAPFEGRDVMPFRYAAFISYRAGREDDAEPGKSPDTSPYLNAVRELKQHLLWELDMLLEPELCHVYLDKDEHRGGVRFDRAMATAICESVCMIVVYTPHYFSLTHPYCARE